MRLDQPYPPRLFGYVSSATATAITVSWTTWWATPPTGDVEITDYQLRYWSNSDRSKITTLEFTDPNTWRHRLTGLVADTSHGVQVRSCTNQADCTADGWPHGHGAGLRTRPLVERGPVTITPIPSS